MKGLTNGVFLNTSLLVKITALAVCSLAFFFLGKHWSDGYQQIVFFSHQDTRTGSSPSPSVSNVNLSADVPSLIANVTDSSPQRLSRHRCRCDITRIMLEMDRLLRPGGYAYIRDSRQVLDQVHQIALAMGWRVSVYDTSEGPYASRKILACQKQMLRS